MEFRRHSLFISAVSQFGLFRRRVGVFSAVWTGLTFDAELKSQLDEATVEYRWGDAVR